MDKKPIRIQRKRTKGCKMPHNTVYVGRPSKWGNPFKVGFNWIGGFGWQLKLKDALKMYKSFIIKRTQDKDGFSVEINHKIYNYNKALDLSELKGKNLACWCPLDKPCHADVLLKLAI